MDQLPASLTPTEIAALAEVMTRAREVAHLRRDRHRHRTVRHGASLARRREVRSHRAAPRKQRAC
jgi:hypothetical protein